MASPFSVAMTTMTGSRVLSPFLDPVVGVEVNVTSFTRFAVHGGYRIVRGVERGTLALGDASGATLGAALEFGSF